MFPFRLQLVLPHLAKKDGEDDPKKASEALCAQIWRCCESNCKKRQRQRQKTRPHCKHVIVQTPLTPLSGCNSSPGNRWQAGDDKAAAKMEGQPGAASTLSSSFGAVQMSAQRLRRRWGRSKPTCSTRRTGAGLT